MKVSLNGLIASSREALHSSRDGAAPMLSHILEALRLDIHDVIAGKKPVAQFAEFWCVTPDTRPEAERVRR